jgi:hypothetical protein
MLHIGAGAAAPKTKSPGMPGLRVDKCRCAPLQRIARSSVSVSCDHTHGMAVQRALDGELHVTIT